MADGLFGGALPYIYSRAGAFKRSLNDIVSNPMASAEQNINYLNEASRDFNERTRQLNAQAFANPQSPLQVTNPQALSSLTEQTMNGAMGFAPVGMVGKFTGGMLGSASAPVNEVRTGVIQDPEIIKKFGSKAERERLLQKRVLQDAEDAAAQDAASEANKLAGTAENTTSTKKVRAAYKGKAIPADYWRQLEQEKGQEFTLEQIKKGSHLRPDGKGGYIGAPRTIDSPQALTAFRRSLDQQFKDGVKAIEASEIDPYRVGTWYDRAKQGMAMSNEPNQLARTLEGQAVYSAGVSPESELAFALKHLNSRAVGEPTMAYRGAGMRNLDTAVAEDRPANLAFKVGEYRNKNDPALPNTGLFGVNDFRAAQGFGYTTPDGKIWKGGVTDQMHSFMDAETALAVDRARNKGVGGRNDWQGSHLQEIPWVYGKAQDLYTRGENARFAGDPGVGIAKAIREANKTAQDYYYKHTGSVTHEEIPGAITGAKSIVNASPEDRIAYSNLSRWDINSPYTLPEAPTTGEGKRDAIYSALGFRQLPSIESAGLFKNALGQVERNPMTIARPLLDFPTGGGGGVIAPNTQQAMNSAERFRAVIDAQEAGAYNLPNTGVGGANGILFDSRPATNNLTGIQPTAKQIGDIGDLLDSSGFGKRFGVTATNRGINIFPFAEDSLDAQALRALKKISPQISEIFPSVPMTAKNTLGYVGGVTGNRFTGESTAGLLDELSKVNPTISMNLSESEAIRNKIRGNISRDASLADFPQDIQNTRNFFAESDWPVAVNLIRNGMTPAAALASMGYSLNSMASPISNNQLNYQPATPMYTDPFGNTIGESIR